MFLFWDGALSDVKNILTEYEEFLMVITFLFSRESKGMLSKLFFKAETIAPVFLYQWMKSIGRWMVLSRGYVLEQFLNYISRFWVESRSLRRNSMELEAVFEGLERSG